MGFFLEIQAYRKTPVGQLPYGLQKRVDLGRALAMEPQVLLLDEPLSSLDLARRQEVLPWLDQLHRDLQIPVLYVTHAMEELTRLADHVVLMHEGKSIRSVVHY